MGQKYRFPNLPHIIYFNNRPINNLALPPTYIKTPEMSQTSSHISTRYHMVPANRTSIDSDSSEDERLLVSTDVPDNEPEPQPPKNPTTIHPTLWLRLISAMISLGVFLTLTLAPNRPLKAFIPVSVFLLLSVCWNLLVLICNFCVVGPGKPSLLVTGARKDGKRSNGWWIRILVELVIILGAVLSIIIVCAATWPFRHGYICSSQRCLREEGLNVLLTVTIIFGAIGIAIELVSLLSDGGAWRSCKIGLISVTPGSSNYMFQAISSSDQLLPTSTIHQSTKLARDEHKVKLSVRISLFTRILVMCLMTTTAFMILIPGFRRHDPLVVFMILMAVTNGILLVPEFFFAIESCLENKSIALPLKDEGPKKGFRVRHFLIFWHAVLLLGGVITWIISLANPGITYYRGSWHVGTETPWIFIAFLCILLYAVAALNDLRPASLYVCLSGDPDIISTWRLRFGLKFRNEKKIRSARIATPEESVYHDEEAETFPVQVMGTKTQQAENLV